MMGHKENAKNAGDMEALCIHCKNKHKWRAGIRARAKTRFSRRVRRQKRLELKGYLK